MEFKPANVRRVLIYRLGSLGDTIVALPALHVVERAFPSAHKMLLTNIPVHVRAPAAAAILEGSGLVHGYQSYPVGTRSPRELLPLWWKIRRYRPDVLVYLAQPRGEKAVERDQNSSGCAESGKLWDCRLEIWQRRRFDEKTGLWEQEAHRLLRCMRELGAADVNDVCLWDLRLTAAELAKGDEALATLAGRPLIVCGPATKMQSKDWGQDKWRELLTRLSERFTGAWVGAGRRPRGRGGQRVRRRGVERGEGEFVRAASATRDCGGAGACGCFSWT